MCLIYLDSLIWNERLLVPQGSSLDRRLVFAIRGRWALEQSRPRICEQSGKGQLETDCVAGHVGLELPNPRERYPFEVPR